MEAPHSQYIPRPRNTPTEAVPPPLKVESCSVPPSNRYDVHTARRGVNVLLLARFAYLLTFHAPMPVAPRPFHAVTSRHVTTLQKRGIKQHPSNLSYITPQMCPTLTYITPSPIFTCTHPASLICRQKGTTRSTLGCCSVRCIS